MIMDKLWYNQLKNYFLSNQILTICISICFLSYGMFILSYTLSNTVSNIGNLTQKTGVVVSWNRTYGKYNTVRMNIQNDSTIYTTKRYGGWLCLQHSGKQGEHVKFYVTPGTQKTKEGYKQYFGLSPAISPRSTFWLFFDVLFYQFDTRILFFLPFLIGCLCFNLSYLKPGLLRTLSWILPSLTFILFGLATIS